MPSTNRRELAVVDDEEHITEPAIIIEGAGPLGNPADLDGDGFEVDLDADDEDPFVFPGAPEIQCDWIDQDGDGVDFCPPDNDEDGVTTEFDCDDGDPLRGPFVPEVRCNGEDENCDGFDDCDTDGDGIMDAKDPEPAVPVEPAPEPSSPEEFE